MSESSRSAGRMRRVGRTRDARGRLVSMLDPAMLELMHRTDVIAEPELGRMVKEIGPGVPRGQTLFVWTCVILGVTGLVAALVRAFGFGFGLDRVGRALWLVNAVCLVMAIVGLWARAKKGRQGRIRAVMLKCRFCPHCGYDLRGLPVAEDGQGATICPECGCAWKLGSEGDPNGS